jgi:hypothetical protein
MNMNNECFKRLLNQGYLTKFKPDPREEQQVYLWGPRSKALFTEEKVIEFMVSVYPEADEEKVEKLKSSILLSADGV